MMRTILIAAELVANILLVVVETTRHQQPQVPSHAGRAALFHAAQLQQTAPRAPREQAQPPRGEEPTATLQDVAVFEKFQPTGVAVSKSGRVFVNFPLWSDEYRHAVVEVMPDGSAKPYPDEQWNSWQKQPASVDGHGAGAADQPRNPPETDGPRPQEPQPGARSARDPRQQQPTEGVATAMQVAPARTFVCVQALWVDDMDRLWILDPASPRMEGVVPGGAKLVCVNLGTNQVEKVYEFSHEIAPRNSYLNDVRIDTSRDFAYMTESGMGAIIALNLKTGEARRLLGDHPSTRAESNVKLVVQGIELRDEKTGGTPQIHADGIALSPDGDYLYWHALTGKTLYRIPTEALRGDSMSDDSIGERVERVAQTVVTDGMLMDERGRIYHTALEMDAIVRFDPETKRLEMVVRDERIAWPDSMAWGPDGALYFTTSRIHEMPHFNKGQDKRSEPYRVYKIDGTATRDVIDDFD